VEVLIPRGAGAPLIHPRPMTGLEGKFSMEYCVAAALLGGKVGLDAFEDESVRRAPAQELLRRVEMLADASESAPAEGFTEVTITMQDGRHVSRRVDDPRGSAEFPLSDAELHAKYQDCAARVLGVDGASKSAELILGLDALASVLPLTETLISRATLPVGSPV
jgi:2-methylcitrate dehydratase PrpD